MLLLCVLALLAGCGAPAPDDVLHRANETEPGSLDPHGARTVAALNVLRDIGEGLVTLDAAGELKPGLAAGWQVSDDGLRWTFELRDGLRWSNGEPLDARDFVYSFRRLVAPATAAFNADLLDAVEGAPEIIAGDLPPEALGVHAPGPLTLELRLTRAVPWLTELLTHPAAHPVPEAVVAAHGDRWARPGNHVTAGAYRLDDWVPGTHITLRANPYYHRADSVAITEVRHHATLDRQAEYNRYRAGELHITANVPTRGFDTIRERHGDQLRVAPFLGIYYFGYNLTRAPFADNEKLRRALSLAVDRERIARDVVGRGEIPAWTLVPPALGGYEPPAIEAADWSRERRLREARALFEAAGYTREQPPEVEILHNHAGDNSRIALAVQTMWQEAFGFTAPLRAQEFQVMLQTVRSARETTVFRLSWVADYEDPHSFLAMFRRDHSSNLTGYSSDDYDRLLDEAREAPTARERLERLADAEARLLADQPLIPVYRFVSKHLVSPRVQGWRDHPRDIHLSRHLSLRTTE